ncbi:hypothetical protein FB639_000425 [Coemansia asiatica]|nr:hypothetical protein FB639_000425 [Coemansia asiatica]
MSVSNFAGLIVYRVVPREPIEYLLICKKNLNGHSHWYPPKGKIIGTEDELNDPLIEISWCRLDDALTKVRFQSMQNILVQAEEYIESNREDVSSGSQRSGWKTVGPKESPSAWRNQRNNSGDVEGQFRRLNVGDGQRSNRNFVDRDQQQQQQQQQQQTQKNRPQDNPLYKTRLCEKYERDGECPYNEKCVFAHSASELRERKVISTTQSFRKVSDDRSREHAGLSPQQHQHQDQDQNQGLNQSQGHGQIQQQQFQRQNSQQYQNQNQFSNLSHSQSQSYQHQQHQQHQQQPRTPQSATVKFDANPLYKTRLCARFTEKGECPYNEKCQFAHGEKELRAAPEQPAQVKSPRDGQFVPRTPNDHQGGHGTFNRNVSGQSQTWRRGGFGNAGERAQIPNFNRNASWSSSARQIGNSPSFSDDGSMDSPRYPVVDQSPKPADGDESDLKAPLAAPLITPVAQKIPPPGLVKLASANASTTKPQETKPSADTKGDVGSEKPWIKVVELSYEELQQMGSPLLESANGGDAAKSKSDRKLAELEKRLAKDLAEFIQKASCPDEWSFVHVIFKEITQMEFRNNLDKQQLLNIVVAALFGPTKASGVSEAVGRYSKLLAKIVTKPKDQLLMLNAWCTLMLEDENAAAWQDKAPEVLGALYKDSLLEEDAFSLWFNKKRDEKYSPAISAMQPFAKWLETAEEE